MGVALGEAHVENIQHFHPPYVFRPEHYSDLVDTLNAVKRFDWHNLSVQYDMRYRNMTDADLHAAIRERISQSDVLLAFTAVTMSHKDWIKEELSIATLQVADDG